MGNAHESKFQRSRKDPRTKKRRKRSASSKNTNDVPPQNNVGTEGNVVDTNEKAGETEQEEKEEDTSIGPEECCQHLLENYVIQLMMKMWIPPLVL